MFKKRLQSRVYIAKRFFDGRMVALSQDDLIAIANHILVHFVFIH